MDIVTLLWLGALGAEDWKKKEVSTILLIGGGIALCIRPVWMFFAGEINLPQIFSATCPGVVLLVLAFATGKIGTADGLAVLFLGLFAGRDRTWLMLCISLLGMALLSIVLLATQKAGRQSRLPFFPFLFLGWGVSLWLQGGFL